jgi:hypothetical protein
MLDNLLVEFKAFKMLVSNLKLTNGARPVPNKFVKMMNVIHHLDILVLAPRKNSLILHESVLMGKFMGL